MKYIIVEEGGLELPVIFPVIWNHSDVAARINDCNTVVSAGFLKRNDSGNLYVTGGSTSLRVKSRPEDLDLILKHLKFEL